MAKEIVPKNEVSRNAEFELGLTLVDALAQVRSHDSHLTTSTILFLELIHDPLNELDRIKQVHHELNVAYAEASAYHDNLIRILDEAKSEGGEQDSPDSDNEFV